MIKRASLQLIMRIIVCGIAKKENKYINEWVNHYIKLGFDHIYLYDNNDLNYPYVGDYIENKDKVTILDWRGRKEIAVLSKAYLDCYNTQDFDWCLFCDIDEFLVGINEIHNFFNTDKFNNFEQIRVMWEYFGDDGVIERDESIPVMDFFKVKLTNDNHHNVGKFFLRSGLELADIEPHFAWGKNRYPLKTCFPSGKPSYESATTLYIKPQGMYQITETIYLNHYMTKTLKEFLDQKYQTPDVMVQQFLTTRGLNYFWHLNKKTPKKEEYIKNYLKKND